MANLQVTHAYSVNANTLALRIETGEIKRGKQVDYAAQPGDEIFGDDYVRRDGKDIGRLLEAGTKIRLFDEYSGLELNSRWATNAANYTINGARPKNAFIKSKPGNSARTGRWKFQYPMEHTVYLEMPKAMTAGQRYRLNFQGDELQDLDFTYSPKTVRSEAVHISHLGFHPDDSKLAFLSAWMGTRGKGVSYKAGQKFWLVDNNGKRVHEGKIQLSRAKNEPEDFLNRNYNGTNVYVADFSTFDKKGRYRVVVEGVGTSFDFKIGDNTWEDAFQVSMEGLYAHRSGLKKGAPFSDYTAPRSFHPDDGVKVYQSTAQFRYTKMGLGNRNTFKVLSDGATNKVLDFAWGGWKDAGDWDRNARHLSVSRQLLELGEMFPEYFVDVDLTIPESKNQLADVIDEALWGVDFFQRMQRKDGGVRGGIESAKHPDDLEVSWQESQKVMAYAPDAWSSYMFAGVAARAAHLLKSIAPARAKGYIDSAVKAMKWAEREQAMRPDNDWQVLSDRNLAAVELYRTTGSDKWHQIFLDDTAFKQPVENAALWKKFDHRNAAFVYARIDRPDVDRTVQTNAINAVLKTGDFQLAATNKAGFRWSKNPYVKVGFGANDGFADRVDITRAHFLSGDVKYLKGAVDGAQFQGGANPDNVSFTTGIGPRDPDNVLFEDGISAGVEPPKGISIYGPVDLSEFDHWALDLFRGKMSPQPEAWPTSEGFFDVARYVAGAEYTVTETIAPTAYSWGYLAAHNATKKYYTPSVGQTVDLVEPQSPIGGPDEPAVAPLRYEAESLVLEGYRRRGDLKEAALGEKYVSLEGAEADTGSAKGVFNGPAGRYRVWVGYFDEADGRSRASLKVGDRTRSFYYNKKLPGIVASAATKAKRLTHSSIMLKPGDTFEFISDRRRLNEQGALDYIEFEPINATVISAVESTLAIKNVEDLLIDLTTVDFDNNGETDEQVQVTFKTESDAEFDNTVGFYTVDNAQGAITDPILGTTLMPGDKGYRQSAIANRLTDLDMARDTGRLTTTLDTGKFLAPFIVANRTPEDLEARPWRNMRDAYFAYEAANSDRFSHIVGSRSPDSDQTFGFEDRRNGMSQSFDDVIVNAKVFGV